jgi:hypothetical protein
VGGAVAKGGGTGAEQRFRRIAAAALGLLDVDDAEGARAVLREFLRGTGELGA